MPPWRAAIGVAGDGIRGTTLVSACSRPGLPTTVTVRTPGAVGEVFESAEGRVVAAHRVEVVTRRPAEEHHDGHDGDETRATRTIHIPTIQPDERPPAGSEARSLGAGSGTTRTAPTSDDA